jgi:hypothetical protein
VSAKTCTVTKKATFCVGDRVERTVKVAADVKKRLIREGFWRGTIVALEMGRDNSGRAMPAARVKLDGNEPGDLAYPYLLVELKKQP